MTEQEFRDQAAALGLTIEVTDHYDSIIETKHTPNYIYHSRRANNWCTMVGPFGRHDTVISCVLEWQRVYGIQIIDPIIHAARLAEKKP